MPWTRQSRRALFNFRGKKLLCVYIHVLFLNYYFINYCYLSLLLLCIYIYIYIYIYMQVLRSFVCAPLVFVISVVLLHHNALGCYKPSPNGRLNKLGCPLLILFQLSMNFIYYWVICTLVIIINHFINHYNSVIISFYHHLWSNLHIVWSNITIYTYVFHYKPLKKHYTPLLTIVNHYTPLWIIVNHY